MKYIENIPDLYSYSALQRMPAHEDFDVLLFDQFGQGIKRMMPPHRRGFYTIIFLKDQKGGQISINEKKHTSLTNTILFQGTEHIFSFIRDEHIEGTVLLFKKSFLLPYVNNTEGEFPFFSIINHNLFHLNSTEQKAFQQILESIHAEQSNLEVAKPLLIALLEKSKLLYNTYTHEEQFLSKKAQLVRNYKNLINNHFIENKSVDHYASLLNITPNYLNEVVKSETGSSAKKHILERTLLEAKNLLLYSELDISEISHLLRFSEPTHFTKFFKKETGFTPKAYQNQKP